MIEAIKEHPLFLSIEVFNSIWGFLSILVVIAGFANARRLASSETPAAVQRIATIVFFSAIGFLFGPIVGIFLPPDIRYLILDAFSFVWSPRGWSQGFFFAVGGASIGCLVGMFYTRFALTIIGGAFGAIFGAMVAYVGAAILGSVVHFGNWGMIHEIGMNYTSWGAIAGAALFGLFALLSTDEI